MDIRSWHNSNITTLTQAVVNCEGGEEAGGSRKESVGKCHERAVQYVMIQYRDRIRNPSRPFKMITI